MGDKSLRRCIVHEVCYRFDCVIAYNTYSEANDGNKVNVPACIVYFAKRFHSQMVRQRPRQLLTQCYVSKNASCTTCLI